MDELDPAPTYTVAQLARIAGVTPRTLHHYDRIGLLVPASRSDAEYRLYGRAELARLREVLVWRRLGLPLAEIARLLDDPTVDRRAVLSAQRTLATERIRELAGLVAALDRTLDAADESPEPKEHDVNADRDIIDSLDGFDPADHEDETLERWGQTDAYRESMRRASTYSDADWERICNEKAAGRAELNRLFDAGASPTSDEAVAAAEAWRQHVSRSYYECTPEQQRALGEMYVADPRFRAAYDGESGDRAGMAEWVRDAWAANADRLADA